GSAAIRAARASAAGRTAFGRRSAGIAFAGAFASACTGSRCLRAAARGRRPAAHAGPRRHSVIDRYAGVPLLDDDGARRLVVPRVAALLDDRCRGLAVDVVAGLLLLCDVGGVARRGAPAHPFMAAAGGPHAVAPGTRADGRAGSALPL